MTLDDEEIVFESTGRRAYQYGNIIGIEPNLTLSYGYDGSLWLHGGIRPAERAELADYMIALWQRFKDAE